MKPFNEELAEILERRGMSIRELSRRSTAKTGWGSAATIQHYVQGRLPPTLDGMEAIAKTLNMDPERFSEYRMAALRNDLTPEKVGWERAAETLRLWEGE